MARMLGRYRSRGCCPGYVRGPDCVGGERDTRQRKRIEQRQVRREVAALLTERALHDAVTVPLMTRSMGADAAPTPL